LVFVVCQDREKVMAGKIAKGLFGAPKPTASETAPPADRVSSDALPGAVERVEEVAGTEDVEEDWVRVEQLPDPPSSSTPGSSSSSSGQSTQKRDATGIKKKSESNTVAAATLPSASSFSLDAMTTTSDAAIEKAAAAATAAESVPEHENIYKIGAAGLVMALIVSGVVYALNVLTPAAQ
jgi:hypothetical protein